MQELSATEISGRESRRERRYFVAVAWGVLMGCLTFAAGPLAWLSANPIIAAIQWALTVLLIPGLLCAAMIGSLIPGAFVNAVFHFGSAWLVLASVARLRKSADARR
jgi:hypothetical protein